MASNRNGNASASRKRLQLQVFAAVVRVVELVGLDQVEVDLTTRVSWRCRQRHEALHRASTSSCREAYDIRIDGILSRLLMVQEPGEYLKVAALGEKAWWRYHVSAQTDMTACSLTEPMQSCVAIVCGIMCVMESHVSTVKCTRCWNTCSTHCQC